jgi:hypothetical protein
LARLRPFSIQELFPWATDHEHCEAPSVDEELGGEAPFDFTAEDRILAPAAPLLVDVTGSLYFPGLLHIVHNATEGLTDALSGWDDFVGGLRELAAFLARPYARQRLRETCFSNPPADAHRHLFMDYGSVVFEGRWGTVVQAIASILPLEEALRLGWSKERFMFGQSCAPAAESNDYVHKVDLVIGSSFGWTYCKTIDAIAEILAEICQWAEGCACHFGEPTLSGPSRHIRARLFRQRVHLGILVPLAGPPGSRTGCWPA